MVPAALVSPGFLELLCRLLLRGLELSLQRGQNREQSQRRTSPRGEQRSAVSCMWPPARPSTSSGNIPRGKIVILPLQARRLWLAVIQ